MRTSSRTPLQPRKKGLAQLGFQEIAQVAQLKASLQTFSLITTANLTKTTMTSTMTIKITTQVNMWKMKFSKATKQNKIDLTKCKNELTSS